MNIETLRAELTDDPLGRSYSGMTDAEAAASLNTVNRTRYVDVPISTLAGLIELSGMYEKLAGDQSGNVYAAKLLRIANGSTPISALAYSDAGKRAVIDGMLAALIGASILTEADAASLLALGVESISRADELGLGAVAEGHVFNVLTRVA